VGPHFCLAARRTIFKPGHRCNYLGFRVCFSLDKDEAAPTADGFVPLFNGKDLAGWYVESGDVGQWTVEKDAIVGRSAHWSKRNYLLSNKDYADFTIQFEFMIEAGGYGGVALRAFEGEQMPLRNGRVFEHPLIKLSDSAKFPDEPSGTTKWVKDDKEASRPAEDPKLSTGAWHAMEITVRGERYTAILAGKKVADLHLDLATGDKTVPALKRNKGKIGFQAHTGTVRFRKIDIKELPPRDLKADLTWEQLLESRVFVGKDGKTLPYRFLSPEKVEEGKKYPLVIFLHGAGERGNDNKAQLLFCVKDLATANARAQYPCYLVAPQCPTNDSWIKANWALDKHTMEPNPSASLGHVLEMIRTLTEELPGVDSNRVYVAGLSMGAFGAWELLQRAPELFAAGVPICGGGDEAQADQVAKVPVWAFHGENDTVVKPMRSGNMVDAVKKTGGLARLTIYKGEGHNIWNRVFSDGELLNWMFGQKKQRVIGETGAQPKPDGFVPLFNGKDLTGWYVESGDAGQWAVEKDAIVGRSAGFSTRNYLLSNKEYTDFALRLEFMTDPEAAVGFCYERLTAKSSARTVYAIIPCSRSRTPPSSGTIHPARPIG
jgi:predicted peptidase